MWPPRGRPAPCPQGPRGEVRLYPDGHFDIYLAGPFERVVKDQLAFLARHVPAGTSPATR